MLSLWMRVNLMHWIINIFIDFIHTIQIWNFCTIHSHYLEQLLYLYKKSLEKFYLQLTEILLFLHFYIDYLYCCCCMFSRSMFKQYYPSFLYYLRRLIEKDSLYHFQVWKYFLWVFRQFEFVIHHLFL